ncbi:hypothetical protein K504DRAFT_420198 [Pleomassaria siparia CBS 279.74]|uniref:Uncharacterized protein n=1 Tax=Pleomassaria siparia CBS 279.74 TaxID=1314801 RepID=A0A6G1KP34_9PLEO|nr:hypothetical protein K504DRAFT_420198 [Pleomassaria siparia CBS 279.74]
MFKPQDNRNGWVNPEDLVPMPQCIAQQDQTTWLSAMTKCTRKQCTRHFGIICTHHQWLTQLSCLSTEFSSDVVKIYIDYCSRSILAKAQLYLWILGITGRTWLVDVGDTNELESTPLYSLVDGYAPLGVAHRAPTCLTSSVSAPSMEPFQHVMASCAFTSTTQHTGNAARPWEYSESLGSMIPLDSETVGYSLTGRSIRDDHYFDKACFCSTFSVNPKQEPCPGWGIELTRERLWMYATCGPTSVPENWTDVLKMTGSAYIPMEDWHWPARVTDMPKQVTVPAHQCAVNACESDPDGYCNVRRAVDRSCFCHNVSFNSCGSLCEHFEDRIGYVKWLQNLCGKVQGWHGFPDDWRHLAIPLAVDMIPWRWTVKPSNGLNDVSMPLSGSTKATQKCASNGKKLGGIALVNTATFLAIYLSRRTYVNGKSYGFLGHLRPGVWIFNGILVAGLQLLANWFNASLVQNTIGYEDVPVAQLMLLWCTMPRLTWLPVLLIGVQPFEMINFSAAASSLFVEVILQVFSLYYMILTVSYGLEHDFYFGGMEGAEREVSAQVMYAGALLWLMVTAATSVQLMRITPRMKELTRSASLDPPTWQRNHQTTSNIVEEMMAQIHYWHTSLGEKLARYWSEKARALEEESLLGGEGRRDEGYGTLPFKRQHDWVSSKGFVQIYAVPVSSMVLLWIAQWLFWGGFISLSSDEFCLPKVGVLTAVWFASSLAGAAVTAVF